MYTPDWVDPKQYDSFDVEVEVTVVSIEPTELTVDLSIGTHYDQKLVQAQAGENTYQVTFDVPISQVQTVSYDASVEATVKTLMYVPEGENVEPIQQQQQNSGLLVIIDSKTDNGSSDTSTTNGPLISEVDIGARVTIGTRLPYPENRDTVNNRFSCETKQWARLSRHSTVLSDMVNKRQTYPQWIQALGVGINVQWTKVGNIDFEVISATVEVIRLPNNFAEAGTTYVNQGVFTVSGNSQFTSTVWGKNYDVPSGEYKVRVTYRVKYTVNGEDVEDEFQEISNDSFFVKRKRANPCDMDDFHHQTIYEKKTSVGTGRTDFRLNEQGDVSSGSYSPGASSQGVGGMLGVPTVQTVAFIPVQAQSSPVTLYLDWDDPSADLDLTVIDPLGRTVTYLYSEGLVVNGIPGVVYSGINVKPEWIRFESTVEGEYIVSAYLVKSTGAVDAWFRVGESITTEVEVTYHILGSGLDTDDTLSGVGLEFTPDDIVYSRIDFSNIGIGDTVRWVFTGPNGISVEKSTEMAFSGEAYAYAPMELVLYDADLVTGAWSVIVYVNDVAVSIVSFTVDSSDPLGGLIPGFPVLGLLTGLAVIVWGIRWRQPSRGYQV